MSTGARGQGRVPGPGLACAEGRAGVLWSQAGENSDRVHREPIPGTLCSAEMPGALGAGLTLWDGGHAVPTPEGPPPVYVQVRGQTACVQRSSICLWGLHMLLEPWAPRTASRCVFLGTSREEGFAALLLPGRGQGVRICSGRGEGGPSLQSAGTQGPARGPISWGVAG